jgi:hypothetical protein
LQRAFARKSIQGPEHHDIELSLRRDMRRQRFFTASAKRTSSFYEVFRDSAQVEQKTARQVGSSSIEDLFRELPIDAEGQLEFPG